MTNILPNLSAIPASVAPEFILAGVTEFEETPDFGFLFEFHLLEPDVIAHSRFLQTPNGSAILGQQSDQVFAFGIQNDTTKQLVGGGTIQVHRPPGDKFEQSEHQIGPPAIQTRVELSQQAVPKNLKEYLTESISRQTIAAIENNLPISSATAVRSITIEIHPADLGQLNIQIELVADTLQTKIVATENISAELLSKNKDDLVAALSEFGYGQTSVDISHGNHSRHHEHQNEFESSEKFSDANQYDASISSTVILAGINLVA